MRERPQQVLKVTCLALAAFVLVQIGGVVMRVNPLAHVTIPSLPSLPDDPLATDKSTNRTSTVASANKPTDQLGHPSQTNSASAGTNRAATTTASRQSTNSITHRLDAKMETNSVAGSAANQSQMNAAAAQSQTQIISNRVVMNEPHSAQTADTNSALAKSGLTNTDGMMPPPPGGIGPVGLAFKPPRMAGMKNPPLAPAAQARIDRITESEILGQVIRPLPMALLGIAGEVAFLRAPSGQTGLVKPGENLSEIKLLRIGTNRVLIEQDGQEKELTIFSGLGGESLLSKQSGTANENIPK
jgi:hypothetical protein